MKTMKILSIASLLVLISAFSFGQTDKLSKTCPLDDEKIKAEKVAFITERIDLTVKEAQDFWPVYNEFNDKIDVLFKEEHKITKELKKNIATLSDKDIDTKLDRLFAIKNEKNELENTYHEKYLKVLPIKKVALLYQADREFRKHLLQKYKDHPCETDK